MQAKAVLQELCTNSRVRVLQLSRKFQISRYRIAKIIDMLEDKLSLYYTLEPNYGKLGFNFIHIAYLNFTKKPKAENLREILNRINAVQLALLTTGDYMLICFIVTKTAIEYSQTEVALQLLLQEYGARIRSSAVTLMLHGFIPLSNSLMRESAIPEPYKKLLLSLNANSRSKLSEIGKETEINEDAVRHYLTKMESELIIRRYTAIVTKPNTRAIIAYSSSYSVRENVQERIARERRNIIFANDERSNVNDFQMMFSTVGSAQAFNLATYVSKKYGLEHSIEAHNRIYAVDKPEVGKAFVVKVLKGVLPLRYIDVRANYNLPNWSVEF